MHAPRIRARFHSACALKVLGLLVPRLSPSSLPLLNADDHIALSLLPESSGLRNGYRKSRSFRGACRPLPTRQSRSLEEHEPYNIDGKNSLGKEMNLDGSLN